MKAPFLVTQIRNQLRKFDKKFKVSKYVDHTEITACSFWVDLAHKQKLMWKQQRLKSRTWHLTTCIICDYDEQFLQKKMIQKYSFLCNTWIFNERFCMNDISAIDMFSGQHSRPLKMALYVVLWTSYKFWIFNRRFFMYNIPTMDMLSP